MSEWANEQIPTLESIKKPPQKMLSYENQLKFVLNILVIKVKKTPKIFLFKMPNSLCNNL